MSILSWNCRGLRTQRTFQFLKETVLHKKTDVVFLCETLCKRDVVERARDMLGFEGGFSVDVQGKSGGIALIWRDKEVVEILS